MSKTVHLIVVGKLKDKHLEILEQDYLVRIKNPELEIHEVKARAEEKSLEGQEVLKKIKEISKDGSAHIIALCEDGVERNSVSFSNWLFDKLETQAGKLIFVIAGAEGHSDEFMQKVSDKVSLSKLTFPHKIARILFIEQFYRAITIKNNHPYHN
jgi:23S rRNA (pseudouridine1915-N3)-methyltransferase